MPQPTNDKLVVCMIIGRTKAHIIKAFDDTPKGKRRAMAFKKARMMKTNRTHVVVPMTFVETAAEEEAHD